MARLSGKRVLITGTSSGQGEAAQRRFAEEGARVVGCSLQEGAAEKTAALLQDEGYDAQGSTVDLTDPVAARAWVERAAETLGGIDVLYNNAAGFAFAPFTDMTIDLFRQVLRDEVEIVFNTTNPVWKLMIEAGAGSVINTASYGAVRGVARFGVAAHSAAKGAVLALTTALAAEGAASNVRVNAISPGFVDTPATAAAMNAEARDWQLSKHLIQRPGRPEEIAAFAVYLASDESEWVTGQNFSIDGGVTAGFR
ncbi:NAD(P)-dependent dehydrogenase, short-chain alcohol dehydrogenase family [Pseudonocardia ammonioxydans]|uniref:NAD(P)-dependent dehydrogenase, short-chain alcohol dehydrogenase family n=1 Tax=Pseudonocardia ammonioxydans TaxID=260086 RepID=A0A1I5HQ85_PSUAM|nr:SDR family NAD(P)-dependent oxidoreductase [Pseudonocardia ammonioxydans]SFO50066.1 NAD(P)-dependent dehydrogenase, short-chain alcohol dehydrogenase family [Pseudonocardia ammonioxydans]